MPALPFLPPSLGRQVTTREFNLLEMVARSWGGEFSAPDHRVYCFGNGVRCFDSTDLGTTGIYGPQVSCHCAVATPPVLTAAVSPYPDILLNWTASTFSGGTIIHYQIFRQTDGGAFSVLTTVGNILTYLDTTAPIGHVYGYYVVAVPNILGGNSDNSNIASAILSNDPLFADIVLLLHLDGANGQTTTIDSSIVHNPVTINGFGSLSTSSPEFGTACFVRPSGGAARDAVVSLITQGSPLDILSGSTDFTIEGWISVTNNNTTCIPVDYGGDQGPFGAASGGIILQVSPGSPVNVFLGTSVIDSVTSQPWNPVSMGVGTVNTGQWYHWAIQRVNGFSQLFFNGLGSSINVQKWQNYTRPPLVSYAGFGYTSAVSPVPPCRLDEIRVTRGIGRYSGNTYTIPTAPTFP